MSAHGAQRRTDSASLDLARRLEALAAEANQVRSLLRSGKAKESRKRARKQLEKLIDVLEGLQRTVLATPPSDEHRRAIMLHLGDLERVFEDAPRTGGSRAGIEQLRNRVRTGRRALRDFI